MSDASDRVPSDHGTVESHRVHLASVGRTGRLQLPLPGELSCAVDEVVGVCFDGSPHFARIGTTLDSQPALQDAYADRELARTRGGEDELGAWLEAAELSADDPLVLDVLTPGYAYGVRLPGERVVYGPPEQPDSSLTAIARSLDQD